MGKQPSSKPRRPESLGKGKVTPIQIAFIVDRYLCDNNFSETRTSFRNEASSLITNSPIHEAPKSLLSLGEMLDEYICLKEQKVMMEQERALVEHEKNRVQMLLNGIQNAMNAYHANAPPQNLNSVVVAALAPQKISNGTTPPGASTTMQNASNVHSLPQPINTNAESASFSTQVMNLSDRKRKGIISTDLSSSAKKSRGKSSNRRILFQVPGQNTLPQSDTAITNQVASQPSTHHSSTRNSMLSESQAQLSTVSKCLFNQPSVSVPTTTSPAPKTPIITTSSHSDTHISPPDISPALNCSEEDAPTCYTVISTKRVMVSPTKQMAYIESTQCISPAKTGTSDKASNQRDHVRSRLDFGASGSELPTSNSTKDVDLFDIDIDALGTDFSFTEMLNDLEGIDFSYSPASMSPKDNPSGSSQECKGNQVISETEISKVGEVVSKEEMNVHGSDDCLNTMPSVTKCIKILTPVKSPQRSSDQESS
ncbi:hypothetical protein PIB30_067527 [Stylosanthes scabra]|uniref:LisH domain-containing protein n=1 Tax=Stylosanthes scabra TaxID=79078 RepID=A0ABU6YN65_9FABA|nr:hypothetical protein [Stylosanthes scabra]